jgi:hypothetical protein
MGSIGCHICLRWLIFLFYIYPMKNKLHWHHIFLWRSISMFSFSLNKKWAPLAPWIIAMTTFYILCLLNKKCCPYFLNRVKHTQAYLLFYANPLEFISKIVHNVKYVYVLHSYLKKQFKNFSRSIYSNLVFKSLQFGKFTCKSSICWNDICCSFFLLKFCKHG